MNGKINLVISFFILLGFSSCKSDRAAENLTQAEIKEASAAFNRYLDEEFERDVQDSPMMQTRLGRKTNYGKLDDFSNLRYTRDLQKARDRRKYIKTINENSLDSQTRLSYTLFKLGLDNEIEDYEYRFYDYPINQMFGYHDNLPAFLINMHRIDSLEDAREYINRLKAFPKAFKDIIEGMRVREQNGILPPDFVFEKVIESSSNIIKGKPFSNSAETNVLLNDFKEKISVLDLPEEESGQLIREVEDALITSVKPAYDLLIGKLEDQQQRATSDHGVWKFPKGEDFYSNRIKRITTTGLNANEIHQIGLSEVARIHGEMEKIKEQVGFEGSLMDFFEFMRTDEQFYYPNTAEGRAQYLADATSLIEVMKGKLDDLFHTKPEADIIVKAVEHFRERTAGKAFYQPPALDTSRPGIYYANLYDMHAMPIYQMEALAYHEGIPGHHMQLSIAQELEGLPMFRKFKHYIAYVEGWGLYSELLPKEIGFYEDPYSDFGRLSMELWRSCRLVVDTGIHWKKWTREQGIAYYKENTPNSESDCIKMVERHIVMPGQATAYKIGMNKIVELREEAKAWMGEEFDLREFHDVVLVNGSVPLNVLEQMVQDWADAKRRRE